MCQTTLWTQQQSVKKDDDQRTRNSFTGILTKKENELPDVLVNIPSKEEIKRSKSKSYALTEKKTLLQQLWKSQFEQNVTVTLVRGVFLSIYRPKKPSNF